MTEKTPDATDGSDSQPADKVTALRQAPGMLRQAPGMIVGVGASAGGFEAFKELLEALPERTGIAFIFIQHMDPGRESLLASLLARFTKMTVQQAQGSTQVE